MTTTFAADIAVLRSQANHEFFVSNWPDHLQRASKRERELGELMAHPCYRLVIRRGEDGGDRLVVRPSPGMPNPCTDQAAAFIQRHRADLIAWVKRTDADRERLREVGL